MGDRLEPRVGSQGIEKPAQCLSSGRTAQRRRHRNTHGRWWRRGRPPPRRSGGATSLRRPIPSPSHRWPVFPYRKAVPREPRNLARRGLVEGEPPEREAVRAGRHVRSVGCVRATVPSYTNRPLRGQAGPVQVGAAPVSPTAPRVAGFVSYFALLAGSRKWRVVEGCVLCDPGLGPIVAECGHWRLVLNKRSQNLLGKCFLALRLHEESAYGGLCVISDPLVLRPQAHFLVRSFRIHR